MSVEPVFLVPVGRTTDRLTLVVTCMYWTLQRRPLLSVRVCVCMHLWCVCVCVCVCGVCVCVLCSLCHCSVSNPVLAVISAK